MDIGADGTTLRSCRPAAVLPPSISSLQLYARVAAVVEADSLIGAFYARVAAVVEADSLIGACHLSPHLVRISIACP